MLFPPQIPNVEPRFRKSTGKQMISVVKFFVGGGKKDKLSSKRSKKSSQIPPVFVQKMICENTSETGILEVETDQKRRSERLRKGLVSSKNDDDGEKAL